MSISPADSFAVLLKPHLPKLFRLACRLTNTTADAEDLLQDVLLKLYSRRSELSSIRDLPPWLGRVLYNQFIDDVRRYGRQPLKLVQNGAEIEELADYRANPENAAAQSSDSQFLINCLAKLSEEHRLVLVMHDVEGYTLKEVEELTGIGQGTLKSRLHRARQRLRTLLKKDGTFFSRGSCNTMNGDNVDAL